MADKAEILIVGNLRHDVQLLKRDGSFVATTQVCASRRRIHNGTLVDDAVCLTIEVRGASEAHAFAAYNRKGSRVVLRGQLEERSRATIRQLPYADRSGVATVEVEQHTLVVVVEDILADGATLDTQPSAQGTGPQATPAPIANPNQGERNGDGELVPGRASAEHHRPARSWHWLNQKGASKP